MPDLTVKQARVIMPRSHSRDKEKIGICIVRLATDDKLKLTESNFKKDKGVNDEHRISLSLYFY